MTALTDEQEAELRRYADNEPHRFEGRPNSNLIRRNLLIGSRVSGVGYYRITEAGRAALAERPEPRVSKRMPVAEFREFGLLQELNRRFLHPLGLALEVAVDPETGAETFGGIWDHRDDPEGIYFGGDPAEFNARERAVQVALAWERRRDARIAAIGYMVQPLGKIVDGPLT